MQRVVAQQEINKNTAKERDLKHRKRNTIIYWLPEKNTDNVFERKISSCSFSQSFNVRWYYNTKWVNSQTGY